MSSVVDLIALSKRAPDAPGLLNEIVAAFQVEGTVSLLREIANDDATSRVAGYILSELGERSRGYDECVLEFLDHPEPSIRAGAVTLAEFCVDGRDPRVFAVLGLLGSKESNPLVRHRAARFLLGLDVAQLAVTLETSVPRDRADAEIMAVLKAELARPSDDAGLLPAVDGPWAPIVAYCAYARHSALTTDALSRLVAADEPTRQRVGIELISRLLAREADDGTRARLSSIVFALTSAGPNARRGAILTLAHDRRFREVAPAGWIGKNEGRSLLYAWFSRSHAAGDSDVAARLMAEDESERALALSVALREHDIEALRRAATATDDVVSSIAKDELWVDGAD